jgi:hypothetical protein
VFENNKIDISEKEKRPLSKPLPYKVRGFKIPLPS